MLTDPILWGRVTCADRGLDVDSMAKAAQPAYQAAHIHVSDNQVLIDMECAHVRIPVEVHRKPGGGFVRG